MNQLWQLSKMAYVNFLNTQTAQQAEVKVTDPTTIINKMMTTVATWIMSVATGYAVINGMLAMFSYMSSNPQTQMQGTDKLKRTCFGLVGIFGMQTFMNILEAQAKAWK